MNTQTQLNVQLSYETTLPGARRGAEMDVRASGQPNSGPPYRSFISFTGKQTQPFVGDWKGMLGLVLLHLSSL